MLYCIQVKGGNEAESLELSQTFIDGESYNEIFVPKYERLMRRDGVWRVEDTLLFPGYLFVDSDTIDDVYWGVKKVPRMTKFLRNEEGPQAIYEYEEKFLRGLMDESHTVRLSRGLIVGDEVIITEGALKDYTGRIVNIDRHRREAKLSVKLFGGVETPVKVGLEVMYKTSTIDFDRWKKDRIREQEKSRELKKLDKKARYDEIVESTRVRIEEEKKKLLSDTDKQNQVLADDSNKQNKEIIEDNNHQIQDNTEESDQQTKQGIRVVKGFFSGLEGEYIREVRGKVIARIPIYDRPTEIEFDRSEIEII